MTGDIFHEGGGFCGSCSGVDFFTNNKMGSFDRAQYIVFGNDYESWGRVILADVRGDGRRSLISLDGAGCGYDNPGTFEVALNNGAGGFSSPGPGEGPSCAGDIAAGDINGDGITDITSLSGPSVAGGPGTGIVSLGNGDGKFVSLPPPIERSRRTFDYEDSTNEEDGRYSEVNPGVGLQAVTENPCFKVGGQHAVIPERPIGVEDFHDPAPDQHDPREQNPTSSPLVHR